MTIRSPQGATLVRAVVLVTAFGCFIASPARAQEADEAELSKYYERVDVWHFPVDYVVAYNDQNVTVTFELAAVPPPTGKLCFIKFDMI